MFEVTFAQDIDNGDKINIDGKQITIKDKTKVADELAKALDGKYEVNYDTNTKKLTLTQEKGLDKEEMKVKLNGDETKVGVNVKTKGVTARAEELSEGKVSVQVGAKAVRKAMNKLGEELYPLLLQVQYADTMAQSTYQREEKLERIHKVKVIYEQIIEEKQCFSIRNLAVNGKDLIAIGVTQGKQIGEILNILLEDVLEEPSHNTKEYLLELAKNKIGQEA